MVVLVYFCMGQIHSLQNQIRVKKLEFPKQGKLQFSVEKLTSCKICDIFSPQLC